MKIVIDIPEEIYSFINTQWNDVPKINDSPINIICKAIVDSTPLTERPKGKWIDICVIKAFHYDGEPRVRCSRCGNEEEWSSNYCPNCGAEMNEGEEDGNSN